MKAFPQGQLFNIDDLIADSIDIIHQFKEHIPLHVAFSGGKDSIVLAELVDMTGLPYHLTYHDTTIDPPDVRQFIRKNYPDTIFTRPKKTFWQYMVEKFPPSCLRRWCCDKVKHGTDKSKFVITGVRKEESRKRAKYLPIEKVGSQTICQPILEWPEWAIWEFIEGNHLSYPDIYDAGIDRVGCVICPNRPYKIHKIWRERYPIYYKVFEKHFARWIVEKRGFELNKYDLQGAITDWYKNKGIVQYDKYSHDWKETNG